MFLLRRKLIDTATGLFVIGGFLILIIYSPTVILEIPFFKISHLEINVKDAAVKRIIKETLNKNFSNNWLLLKINGEEFNNLVEKRSKFYVEKVKIADFNFLKGNLKLEIKLNNPVFVLNNNFFLAKNGRIFLYPYPKKVNVPILIDTYQRWQVGQIYPKQVLKKLYILDELYSLKFLKKNHQIIRGRGINYQIIFNLNSDIEKAFRVKRVLERVGYINQKIFINLLGKKSFAVKIYKE